MPDVPAALYMGLIGTDDGQLRAANQAGEIIRYDGDEWQVIGMYEGAFGEFWPDGIGVYFVSSDQLGRIANDTFEVVQQIESGRFSALAGTSPTKLFVTTVDQSLDEYACDGPLVFHFDSDECHLF